MSKGLNITSVSNCIAASASIIDDLYDNGSSQTVGVLKMDVTVVNYAGLFVKYYYFDF